jgi:hypothetical protein
MRRYLYTPWPYPGSSGACSSSFRASNGAGRADAGAALVPAGRGDGKNVWVVFGRCVGSCLGAFTGFLLVSIGITS